MDVIGGGQTILLRAALSPRVGLARTYYSLVMSYERARIVGIPVVTSLSSLSMHRVGQHTHQLSTNF